MTERNTTNFLLVVLIALVVGFGGYFLYQNSLRETVKEEPVDAQDDVQEDEIADDEAEVSEGKSNWAKYSSEEGHFTFEYPTDVFKLNEMQDRFQLMSDQFVYNLQGEGEGKYYFSIRFTVQSQPDTMLETINTYVGSMSEEAFPGGTLESFRVIPALSDNFNVAGREGYKFMLGVEGYNEILGFLPLDRNRTLVIEFNYFDNESFGRTEDDYTMEQQIQIFYSVIDTLKFY